MQTDQTEANSIQINLVNFRSNEHVSNVNFSEGDIGSSDGGRASCDDRSSSDESSAAEERSSDRVSFQDSGSG